MGWTLLTFPGTKGQICREEDSAIVTRDHEKRYGPLIKTTRLGDTLHLKSDWFYEFEGKPITRSTFRGEYSVAENDADKVLHRFWSIRKYGDNLVKVYLGRYINIVMNQAEYEDVVSWLESLSG